MQINPKLAYWNYSHTNCLSDIALSETSCAMLFSVSNICPVILFRNIIMYGIKN